jgi:hypothetical protein
VFPKVTVDGLEVQRKVYVSATIGDDKDGGLFVGDLGSDEDTRVRSSSSGDQTLTRDDRWAVTSDHDRGSYNSDVALAHVFDGHGGADRVDDAELDDDDLAYRWDNVTVPPSGTVTYLSYEIQRGVADADGAAEDELARRAAVAYEASPAQVYAGMSDQELAGLRNWPLPAPTVAFAVSPVPPIAGP